MNISKPSPIRVGISACLLGAEVRFDSGHKRDDFSADVLARYFDFVPVCPEIEVGMGIPREAVRLVGDPTSPRMLGSRSGRDWTEIMTQFAGKRVRAPDLAGLSGFVLKSKSPSCGMERVTVYAEAGVPARNGIGLFARALLGHDPLLPVEEEGRLHDPVLRENFIVRVFAYHRLRELFEAPCRRGDLVRFHAVHKLLLLSHSPKHARALGKLVAQAKELSAAETRRRYAAEFMEALQKHATTRKHTDVLLHILGFLRDHLPARARQDALAVIEDYRHGLLPLVAPMTLLRHYVTVHDVEWIRDQVYLSPHPKELMLRNHV